MSDEGSGNWDSHADEQRKTWKRLSYHQRLLWLEQAKDFARMALDAAAARAKAAKLVSSSGPQPRTKQ